MNKHIAMEAPLDVGTLREDFPILATRVYGKPLAYLDSAASAQKPKQVIERMTYAAFHEYANVHRGLHFLANAATDALEAARESLRGFLNASSSSEIIFTKSATEAINLAAASFGEAFIGEGDEIVLSIMEHHANIVPWHFLRKRKGAVLKWVDVDDAGNFLIEEFERALTKRTKIVAITQMSNVLGTVTPAKEIVQIAHARGIPVLIDGSQGAVHLETDVSGLDADFYCLTGHKLYGPTGVGVLYGKRRWLEQLPPFLGGGEMVNEVTRENVTYNDPPYRFEAGTPPILEAIGLGAAVEYVQRIGRDRIQAHELALSRYAHDRLSQMKSLCIYGRAREKGGIISFNMKGAHAHDVSAVLDQCGVAVRAGTHCAQPLLARFGVTATCRASFALYNTFEEVDQLADALIKAEGLFA
ncbi:MAG TPA: cysteine desulfurase [Methylocella sp.]|nr:cysteine desulfurase [Methylocella sp.]